MVVIYPNRKVEREQSIHFGDFLKLPSVTRIYLDELGESTKNSLGIGLINLVVELEEKSVPQAKKLIKKAQNQLSDEGTKREFIDLIESIIVYKFPQKTREEIEAMFELSDLKQTKVYQEALTEEAVKLVSMLLDTRFPDLSPAYQEQIQGLSTEQLENLAKALLNFGNEGDLRQWLEQHG